MAEIVSYDGKTGLKAILKALDDLREALQASEIPSQEVASYLGCINLHLGQVIGVDEELAEHLERCAGLLCPQCRGYIGIVSDLSSCCYHCGERLFAGKSKDVELADETQASRRSMHLGHQVLRLDSDS